MARVDYFDIQAEIKTILDADAGVSGANINIEIERDMNFSARFPACFIYLDSRSAPPDEQRLAAGTRTDFILRFSLWVFGINLNTLADACHQRDDAIGLIEIALMKNRTLSNKVNALWLDGGEFLTGNTDNGFISGGEIIVYAKTQGTT